MPSVALEGVLRYLQITAQRCRPLQAGARAKGRAERRSGVPAGLPRLRAAALYKELRRKGVEKFGLPFPKNLVGALRRRDPAVAEGPARRRAEAYLAQLSTNGMWFGDQWHACPL